MARERALPDLKARVRVDDTELKKVKSQAGTTGQALKKGLGSGAISAKDLEKRLGVVGSVLSHLGSTGRVVGDQLEQVGGSVGAVGSRLGLLGGAGALALAAIAAGGKHSIDVFQELVGKVDNFQDVVGSSAEESSRLVHAIEVLGVNAESATAAMFKFSKVISTAPESLSKLGIELAMTTDGHVDLAKSLVNVSAAYVKATSQEERNRIVLTAFGKSGRDVIDILEQGPDVLKKLEESTGLIFTDEDIVRARRYRNEMAELQLRLGDTWAAIGQHLVPAVLNAEDAYGRWSTVQQGVNDAIAAGTIEQRDALLATFGVKNAASDLADKLGEEWDAAHRAKGGIQALNQAHWDSVASQKAMADETDRAVKAMQDEMSASIALTRSKLDVKESQGKVNDAYKAYRAAVKEFGVNSRQAREAANDITRATLNQEEAYFKAAQNAAKLAQATHATTDEQRDAKGEVDATIAMLESEAKTLAPNSPLLRRLREYIAMLKNLPIEVSTTISTHYSNKRVASGHGAIEGYAVGGRPRVGEVVMVGEGGPEPVIFDAPATVYSSMQALEHERGAGSVGGRAQVDEVVTTRVRAVEGFALGGRPRVGEVVMVGERIPEPAVFDQPPPSRRAIERQIAGTVGSRQASPLQVSWPSRDIFLPAAPQANVRQGPAVTSAPALVAPSPVESRPADTVIYMDDDRPIVIDGEAIGRLVDRRVAKILHAIGAS